MWSNTSKKNISKLQKVQNFACRIITGKRKFDHITPTLRELRWLPVTSFAKYTLGVLAFKCVKGLAPGYLCHRFKTRDCVPPSRLPRDNLTFGLLTSDLRNVSLKGFLFSWQP